MEQEMAAQTNIPSGTGVDETGGGAAEPAALSDFDYLKQRTGKRHEGQSYETDDDYYRQMRADADEDDEYISNYRKNEEAVNNLFASDPRSADFWEEWKRNPDRNPVAYMIRIYGTDGIREALDNPQFADEFEAANKEFLERKAKDKKHHEDVEANLDKALDMSEAYAQKTGITVEEADQLLQDILDRGERICNGEVTEEDLDWANKAKNYDASVEQAGMEGETRGRNTKIREQLRKGTGDGMPSLGGTAASAQQQSRPVYTNDREQYQSGRTSASQAQEVRHRNRY